MVFWSTVLIWFKRNGKCQCFKLGGATLWVRGNQWGKEYFQTEDGWNFLCFLNNFWRIALKQICKNRKSRLHFTWQLNRWSNYFSRGRKLLIANDQNASCLCLLWQPFIVYILYNYRMTNVQCNLTKLDWIKEGKQKLQSYLLWISFYAYHIVSLLEL